jgi:rfaE bifunctional protein nucleotidyltransferase chain/domain
MDTSAPDTIRDKIRTIDEISKIAKQCQSDGQVIVLAHGVFDLVHMGHVRHLKSARREGDVLMVSITADQFVNKGPGRPIFVEEMRAEMLAALEYVDWVTINHHPTSETVLNLVQPNVYVKGSDYENPEDDISGKISEETEIVERYGGRIVYTKEITFSSSSLINNHLDIYDRPLKAHLDNLKLSGRGEQIFELIESIKDYRVLIVGDAIIDEYQYVSPMGKASKENIIATNFREREQFAGGVFAAANHVANFCKEVEIITSLGNVNSEEKFIRSNLHDNVKLTAIHRETVPTTRKTRFIDPGYMAKLFEVYYFDDQPLEPELENSINSLISERAADFDLVIATDFGHGLIADSTIDTLTSKSRFLAVNTQTNSANMGFNLITRYSRADYICIDAPEAHLAVADRYSDIEKIVSEMLPARI